MQALSACCLLSLLPSAPAPTSDRAGALLVATPYAFIFGSLGKRVFGGGGGSSSNGTTSAKS